MFETPCAPVDLPPHIDILIKENELFCAACITLARALDEPAKRHTLPGILADLSRTHNQLLQVVADHMPVTFTALERGLRSTNDLHAEELAALAIERAAT